MCQWNLLFIVPSGQFCSLPYRWWKSFYYYENYDGVGTQQRNFAPFVPIAKLLAISHSVRFFVVTCILMK